MKTKQYLLILSQGKNIDTYRSENLKHLIKAVIDEILKSYDLPTDGITSSDFDNPYIQGLFNTMSETKALQELVKFKESIENLNIELNKKSNYKFSDPNIRWGLKFEQILDGPTIINGYTIVNKMQPITFHIEKI